jgi:N-acetylmuramoyl-L-alanine amidase
MVVGHRGGGERYRGREVSDLAVAKVAAKDLQAMGYRAYVDRTRDQAVNTPPRDLNGDGQIDHVDEFSAHAFANRHHADLLVSIHFDASTDPTVHGTHGLLPGASLLAAEREAGKAAHQQRIQFGPAGRIWRHQ